MEPQISDNGGDGMIGDCRSAIADLRLVQALVVRYMEYTPNALEERLIDFGAAICKAVRRLPKDYVGTHLHRQLVRSATAPAANYAEARGAESSRRRQQGQPAG